MRTSIEAGAANAAAGVSAVDGAPCPRPQRGRRLSVNIMSETSFWGLAGQGGHTGFLDCVDLMRQHPDLDVRVNTSRQCDVLHSHSWGPYYFVRGARYPGRRIMTAHAIPESAEGSLPLMCAGTRALVRGYLTRVYDYSDVVVAVAPRSAQSIRALGVRSAIEVIPNPMRTERFFPSQVLRRDGRTLLGLDSGAAVVLGVGQLQPRKGIADFVAVARALPAARFIWVGGRPFGLVSAGLFAIEKLIADAPANLRFAGLFDLAMMPMIYNAADVMLFPSLQENCPYAPLEAAACGLPVVFRDLAEYDGLYGPRCAAKDLAGFVDAVRRLLTLPPEKERVRAESMRLAAGFQTGAYVEAMAAIYDRLATGRPSQLGTGST